MSGVVYQCMVAEIATRPAPNSPTTPPAKPREFISVAPVPDVSTFPTPFRFTALLLHHAWGTRPPPAPAGIRNTWRGRHSRGGDALQLA